MMITRRIRETLRHLNYLDHEIDMLRPEEAVRILQENRHRLPSQKESCE